MPNAIWVIVFALYVLVMLINRSKVEIDPWFAWGGWGWFGAILLFKIAPMKIALDSRKCIGNRIGSTLFQSKPVGIIPAEDGHWEMAVYPAGSVGAWNFHDTAITTRSLVIVPKWLAHDYNGQVAFNAWLGTYLDHEELPPHVLRYLKEDMSKPKYDENMPIEFGYWPYKVRKPTENDTKQFKQKMYDAGLSDDQLKMVMPDIEVYANALTIFHPPIDEEKDEDRRWRAMNKNFQSLKHDYDDLMTRHGNLMRLVQYDRPPEERRRPTLPFFPPKETGEEEPDPRDRRGYR